MPFSSRGIMSFIPRQATLLAAPERGEGCRSRSSEGYYSPNPLRRRLCPHWLPATATRRAPAVGLLRKRLRLLSSHQATELNAKFWMSNHNPKDFSVASDRPVFVNNSRAAATPHPRVFQATSTVQFGFNLLQIYNLCLLRSCIS